MAAVTLKGKGNDLEVLRRLIYRLLPVQIMLCAVGAVNGIVSTYFATNYIGVDAMSAVGLYSPVNLLLTTISSILIIGAGILCGKYLGKNRIDRLCGCFTLDIILSVLIAIVCTAVFLFLASFDLTGFITRDEAVRPLFNSYLMGQAIGIIPFMLGNQLSVFLTLENRQKRTLAASLIYIAANLLFSYLFTAVMDMQAFGLALASSLGMWVFFGVQGIHYLSGKSLLSFDMKNIDLHESREMFKTGMAGAMSSWYLTIRSQVVNMLILAYVGSVGISAFAAAGNLLAIFWAVPGGMANLSRILMSISAGEEDQDTLTDIMHTAYTQFILILLALSALLIAFAVPLTQLFYHDPSHPVYMMMVWALRLLPVCMPLSIICSHYICFGEVTGQHSIVHILSLMDGLVNVSVFSLILTPFFGVSGVCTANILNGIVSALIVVAYAYIKNKRFPRSIEQLLVFPEKFGVTENERMDIHLQTKEEVVTVSGRVIDFCRERGLDSRRAYFSGLALEEMAGNVVEHGFSQDRKKHTIDIRIVHKDDDVILRIRDDCAPFDPTKLMPNGGSVDQFSNVGIRLVFGIAKDIQYRNTLGLNVLTVRI